MKLYMKCCGIFQGDFEAGPPPLYRNLSGAESITGCKLDVG